MKLNFSRQGQGPTVILLHGLFGSLSNLGLAAKALADEYSVYQVDLRNHGASPHSPEMNYSNMAADIVELMDNEHIEQVHLLGHSMGGKVAMQVALSVPHRIGKLIVADIAPVTYPRHPNPILDGLRVIEQSRITTRQQADQLLNNYVETPAVRAFLLKNLIRQENGYYGLKLNLGAITEHYEELAQAPAGKAFSGPTLFLKGMDSAYIQSKHKNSILALFPNAKVKVINGAGHWLHSDKPETFSRLVKQFLKDA
jgi:esterase